MYSTNNCPKCNSDKIIIEMSSAKETKDKDGKVNVVYSVYYSCSNCGNVWKEVSD